MKPPTNSWFLLSKNDFSGKITNSRKIVLGKEKPTIGWRLHRSFITLRDFPKLSYVIMILMELMMMTMMMTIVMENDTMIYSMI